MPILQLVVDSSGKAAIPPEGVSGLLEFAVVGTRDPTTEQGTESVVQRGMMALGSHRLTALNGQSALGHENAHIPIMTNLIRRLKQGIDHTHSHSENDIREYEQHERSSGWDELEIRVYHDVPTCFLSMTMTFAAQDSIVPHHPYGAAPPTHRKPLAAVR